MNSIALLHAESPVIEQISKSVVTEESKSENVSLECVATGAPSLTVSWLKGKLNLTAESRMDSNNHVRSTLTIHNPTYEDSGRYTCISTILHDTTGRKEFRAEENAILTVIGEK